MSQQHLIQFFLVLLQLVYNLVGEEGTPPNMVYTYSAEVTDHTGKGTTYAGMGRSKKDAKKACAMEVLMKVFNYIHPGIHSQGGSLAPSLYIT